MRSMKWCVELFVYELCSCNYRASSSIAIDGGVCMGMGVAEKYGIGMVRTIGMLCLSLPALRFDST